jgi:putative hydrolase of the HAD superfamily
MVLKLKRNDVVVFDLDDTLYHEIDYVFSAFSEIAGLTGDQSKEAFAKMKSWFAEKADVFSMLIDEYKLKTSKETLISMYRQHIPDISLVPHAKEVLDDLFSHNITMVLVTDGRSTGQRNKIKALNIGHYFTKIYISEEFGAEKRSGDVFLEIDHLYPDPSKTIIADNIYKDFAWPERLGWTTIGIRDAGRHIHSQEEMEGAVLPAHYINSFAELKINYE